MRGSILTKKGLEMGVGVSNGTISSVQNFTLSLGFAKIFEFLKNFPHPHTWDTLSQCMVLRERSLSTKTSPIAYILKPNFFFYLKKTPPTLTTHQHINTNTTQPPNRNININT